MKEKIFKISNLKFNRIDLFCVLCAFVVNPFLGWWNG
jgi:hypothetical protein